METFIIKETKHFYVASKRVTNNKAQENLNLICIYAYDCYECLCMCQYIVYMCVYISMIK